MRYRFLQYSVLIVCSLISAMGCSRGSYSLVEVHGRLTDGDQAVTGASISYQPVAGSKDEIYPGPGSFGITDSEGRYELKTFNDDRVGAVPGQHKIYISLPQAQGQQDFAEAPGQKHVPAKFTDGSLIVDVPTDGRTEMNFDLKN